MKDLGVRQKFIIKTLIERGPLYVEDLSKLMNLSKRTIDREIHNANKLLKSYKVTITETNSRYEIDGEDDSLKKIYDLLGTIPYQWLLSQEQRQIYIILMLLQSKEPLKSTYFSYLFNVVEGTISMYLDKIEKWLKIRNLTLMRKRGYGIEIEGNEIDKRKAIIELLYSYKPIDEMLSYLYNDSDKENEIGLFLSNIFNEKLTNIAKKIIKEINDTIININDDNNYFTMYLHILTAINRYKSGESIKLNKEIVYNILTSKEFAFIKDVDSIMKHYNIKLSDDELAYLAIHLSGKKYIYEEKEFIELGISLEDLSKELVMEVSKAIKMNIDCDNQLIMGLTQHLEPLLYRLNMGLQSRNPLIEQIREHYNNLFKAVNKSCKLIFSKYNINIPIEEIGYITMHIGAAIERQNSRKKLSALIICPNGIGTAKILANKIKTMFYEIGDIDIGSIRDEYKSKIYDLVVSTVKIEENTDYNNLITVSPFLTKSDIDKIKEYIDSYANKSINPNLDLNDIDNFSNKYIYADIILRNLQLQILNIDNINDLINKVTKTIENMKITIDGNEIKNLILKRESMGNTVIPKSQLALLHTRSDSMLAPFIGVFRLTKPIMMKSIGFSYENVNVIFVMLARRKEDSNILEMLGEISIALAESENFKDVLKFGNIKDIRDELIKILNKSQEDND